MYAASSFRRKRSFPDTGNPAFTDVKRGFLCPGGSVRQTILLKSCIRKQRSGHLSSRKYGLPSDAGGWFSFRFRRLIRIRTKIVTTYGSIL